jgi:hypothetical protein
MQLRTTSIARTYRYVRLALVAVVLFLGVSVFLQVVSGGPLAAVSAAYYTPARNAFVGALCAVALALLALSGRSLEQALLDVAAVLAPVIALVPTPVEPGDVPGVDPGCPGQGACIPAAVAADIANGMGTLAVLGVVALAAAVVLALIQRTLTRSFVAGLAAAAVVVAAGITWWLVHPASFSLGAHLAATIGFFALITAVATIAAVRPLAAGTRRRRVIRALYGAIAAGMGAALAFLAVVVVLRATGVDLLDATGAPLIFLGEAVALVLFALFWLVQTIELWNDADPRLRAAP